MMQFAKILRHGFCKKSIKHVVIISILSILSVTCLVFINKCYGLFYDSLVDKDPVLTVKYLIYYSILLLITALCDAEIRCNKRFFTIHFRDKIYNFYNTDVLDDTKSQYSCQRMSQDLLQFPWQFIDLFATFFHSILLIPSFLYLIIIGGVSFGVIFFCILVAILCSFLGQIIGKPVVNLQYKQESLEAKLRRELIEEIPLLKKNKSLPNLDPISRNYYLMSRKERWLMYFKNTYERLSKCIPYAILIPKYLTSKITLGTMVQSGTALSKLITEISFFVSNIDKIVEFKATINRIYELDNIKKDLK